MLYLLKPFAIVFTLLTTIHLALCELTAEQQPEVTPDVTAALPRVVITDTDRVYDGDTLTRVEIVFPWGVALKDQSIRADFDACEISRVRQTVTITEDELRRGREGRDYLRALLQGCELYLVPLDQSRDRYGRVLAQWLIRDSAGRLIPVADLMRAKNYLRP